MRALSPAGRSRILRGVAIAAALGIITGCSGGGSTTPSTARTSAGATQKTTVVVKLDAPAASATATARRAPKYISPATASIVFTVTNSGGTVISGGQGYVNITSPYTYCSSAGAGAPLTCSDTLSLELTGSGTYTFNVAAYDQAQTANCTPGGTPVCAGNVLSQTLVPETLTVGADNTVSLSLSGLPASIAITTYPGQSSILTNAAGGQFLFGATAFLVDATDADGEPIVGPGAPSFTVSATNGTVTTAPSAAQPNKVTITPTATGTMTVSATATLAANSGATCGSGGVSCTGSASFSTMASALVAVGLASPNQVDLESDVEGALSGSAGTVPLSQTPEFITFCPNGTLVAAGSTQVALAQPPYTSTATLADPGIAGVACDRANTVYVLAAGNVYEYTAPVGSSSTPSTTLSLPSGFNGYAPENLLEFSGSVNGALAVAPNGSVFAVGINGSAAVDVFRVGDATPLYAGAASDSAITLSTDSASNLYVADAGLTQVAEIAAPSYTSSTTVSAASWAPEGGATGSGLLYVGDVGSGNVYAIATPLVGTTTFSGSGASGGSGVYPGPMALDAYGSLFVVSGNYTDFFVDTYKAAPLTYVGNPFPSTSNASVMTSIATFP